MTDRAMPLDEILWRLGRIIRAPDLNDWERRFVASVLRHGKRAAWEPSAKQLRIMRGIIADAHQTVAPMIEEAGG